MFNKRTLIIFAFCSLLVGGALENVFADDIQNAFNDFQKASSEYTTLMSDSSANPKSIALKRQKYIEAKQKYEKLKNSTSISFSQNTSLNSSDVVQKVINKISSGDKITEDDMNLKFPETNDNSLELQIGDKFWKNVISDIKGAKKSITMQMFGMEADKTGWEFARLLAQKAKEGVEITIVADKNGARMSGLSKNFKTTEEEKLFEFYKKNGIKVAFYDRVKSATSLKKKLDFFHYDHRKTFVIDGKIAYVGGYTLQESSRTTKHDMMVKCKGSIVNQIQAGSLLSFKYNGGKLSTNNSKEIANKFFSKNEKAGKSNARLTYNIPRGHHDVHDDYVKQIDSAKKYLYIINPYITNKDLITRLIATAKRGVDVRMVLPSKAENPLNDANMRLYFDKLQDAGVKIYLYKGKKKLGKVHAKGLIADDKFASIGSCNMDTMALRHNYESNVTSTDPKFVQSVKRDLFEKDFKVSDEYVRPKSFWKKIKTRVKGSLAKLFDRWS